MCNGWHNAIRIAAVSEVYQWEMTPETYRLEGQTTYCYCYAARWSSERLVSDMAFNTPAHKCQLCGPAHPRPCNEHRSCQHDAPEPNPALVENENIWTGIGRFNSYTQGLNLGDPLLVRLTLPHEFESIQELGDEEPFVP